MKLEQAIKSDKFRDAQHKAALNILYTAWWLKTVMSRELKAFDLTHEQYNVLRILKGKAPEEMCVKDIGSRMIEKNSNVPRIIDRLVLKNWVARTTGSVDKRHTMMSLTPAGFEILEQSTKKINELFSGLVQMDEQQSTLLNELLEQFRSGEE